MRDNLESACDVHVLPLSDANMMESRGDHRVGRGSKVGLKNVSVLFTCESSS